MSKRNITAPLSPDVVYDTDEDGTKVIIRKFDIPLPSKQGKISERKLEKWKYQHDVPEGKIFTKRVHADLSPVKSPQNGQNLASNVSNIPVSNVSQLQTNVQNIQVVKAPIPIRKDVIVVPPKEQLSKVLTPGSNAQVPVSTTLCSDKITLNNLPENVITNSLKVFDSKFVNGRKVLYLKAVKDSKIVSSPIKGGAEVILTQNEINVQQLKCVPGTTVATGVIRPVPTKTCELKCMYPSRIAPSTTEGRTDDQRGSSAPKVYSGPVQKLKFTSREVQSGFRPPVMCEDCEVSKKNEVQVKKPVSVVVPSSVQHPNVHTLSLASQSKREVMPYAVVAPEALPIIRSGILSTVAHDASNSREITLQINPTSKTNSHILIDTSKQKVNLTEGNISVVGVEFLNSISHNTTLSDSGLRIDDRSAIKEGKLKFVPADSTTPSFVNASTSVPQNVDNQSSTEALVIVNKQNFDEHLDAAVIGNQKPSGLCMDPKIISNGEGKNPVQNIVIMNPTQNVASSNAAVIPKTNMDEIMRRRKIALKFQQDMQRAKETPRIERTVILPARKVNIVDSSTQTSLFCMLEPGRMVEMFLNEDSNDSKITKQSDSQEAHISMKNQSQSANENNAVFSANLTNLSKVTTNNLAATSDQFDPPFSKRIRLDVTDTESEITKGRSVTCNGLMNDPFLTTSMDFEDLIPSFEGMGKENIESTNTPHNNFRTSDIQNNNINNNNFMPLACIQSTLNSNANCIEGSFISNCNIRPDNQYRLFFNKEMKQMLFKDYRNSSIPDEDGNLPLHNAVMDRDIKVVQRQCLVLTAQKLSVDIQNEMKETPLHLAVLCHDLQIVKVLLKYKARTDIPDSEGNTPLHMAIIWGDNIDIFKMLLTCLEDNSPTVNLPNDEGFSPLHLCALHNKSFEALLLVKKNADVNIKDRKSGRTPLFHAVENANAEVSQVLMNAGAHASIPNFSGQTALNASESTFILDKLSRNTDSPKTSKPIPVPCVCQDGTKEGRTSSVSHNRNISGFERTDKNDLNSNNGLCDITLLDTVFLR